MESTVMITVWAGSSPPPPGESIGVPELAHLEVFTSRSSEDGRDRYRLHVGYFPDTTAAKRVLPRVREVYPSAWVVPADRHGPLARLKSPTKPTSPPHSPHPASLSSQTWPPSHSQPSQLSQSQAWPQSQPQAWPLPQSQPSQLAQPTNPSIVDDAATLRPFARQDLSAELTDEVSLDMAAILALLQEESDPPPTTNSDCGVRHPEATVPDIAAPIPQPAFHEAFDALSRLIVEEWRPEAPSTRGSPLNRSWLTRLPRLIR